MRLWYWWKRLCGWEPGTWVEYGEKYNVRIWYLRKGTDYFVYKDEII